MAVTIKDVAKLANVAPSTVSRVIANNPRISEKTKIKVKEAMDYLGYHPNFNARSLAVRSTQAIGLIMPSSADKVFQNPFFPEIMRGISTKAHEKQFALYMSTGMNEQEIFDGVVSMVQGRRVDGIILLYSSMDDIIMEFLLENKFPFTVIGKPFKSENIINHVDNDNFKASKDVTEHLIELGHERIAFIGGSLHLVMTIDRLLGYEKALRVANLPYRNEYIIHQEFLQEGGKEAVAALLALENPPTAFVVVDDLMALGVLGTLSEKGISVPNEVSVVSFNNVMLAELSNPPLTSVDINIFQLGYMATECLLAQIEDEDKEPERITVSHHIVKRLSSGPIRKC